MINTTTYDRAAAIFLQGDSINHNVGYYLNRDRTLTVITYGAVQNSLMTLANGNWYKLVASYKSLSTPPADNVYARAEIFDLGANGLSVPFTIGNTTLMLHDSSLTFSGQFNVRLCGARWGGGEYLDNFTFHGTPGTINCVPTNVNENYFNSGAVTVYPQPANDMIYVSLNQNQKEKFIFYSILDISGRKLMEGKTFSNNLFSIPVQQLSPGIYLLRIKNGSGFINKQIAVD